MALIERFSRQFYVVRWRNDQDEIVEREFTKLIPAIEYRAEVRRSKDIKIVSAGGKKKITDVSIHKMVEHWLSED